MSIKVLHVYKTSLPDSNGGVEAFIDNLCNATEKYGVKNTVFALSKITSYTKSKSQKYDIYTAKQNIFIASTGFSISGFSIFKKLASEADIIHYHFPNPFADILHFLCRIKKPTILTYHSDIIRQKFLLTFYRPLMYKFLESIDHIVATSQNYFDTSEILQYFSKKTTIIPITINKENYPLPTKSRLEYWKNKLPEKFFLFIGSLRYYKGLYVALDAVKGTNINLIIAGNGELEKDLKNYAKLNKIENVEFIGTISDEDKIILLTLCYAFVFPSYLRSEAFGIALLEAAAFGKAMISCEIGTGTSFINIDLETGLVIKPNSSNALKKAMEYLLENPDKVTEFGKNAVKRFKKEFLIEKCGKSYYELYKNLLQKIAR